MDAQINSPKSVFICQTTFEMDLAMMRDETKADIINYKKYGTGFLVLLKYSAKKLKRHSTVDNLMLLLDDKLKIMTGSATSSFVVMSDVGSGKVRSFSGRDRFSDHLFREIFDVSRFKGNRNDEQYLCDGVNRWDSAAAVVHGEDKEVVKDRARETNDDDNNILVQQQAEEDPLATTTPASSYGGHATAVGEGGTTTTTTTTTTTVEERVAKKKRHDGNFPQKKRKLLAQLLSGEEVRSLNVELVQSKEEVNVLTLKLKKAEENGCASSSYMLALRNLENEVSTLTSKLEKSDSEVHTLTAALAEKEEDNNNNCEKVVGLENELQRANESASKTIVALQADLATTTTTTTTMLIGRGEMEVINNFFFMPIIIILLTMMKVMKVMD